MRAFVASLAVAGICFSSALGMNNKRAKPTTTDPFQVGEYLIGNGSWWNNHGYTDTSAKTRRNQTINTGIKNLILIIAGQSLMGAESPTAYTPTNSTAIDQLNIYDGAVYAMSDPPLGSTYVLSSLSGSGAGSIGGRVADQFVSASVFARVVLVPVAVGASLVAQWGTGGALSTRICVALARLNAIGFTAQTNVTVGILWGQGEADNTAGTSQANYTTSLNQVIANAQSCGFSGRFFVNKETWSGGAVLSGVQTAQAAVVNSSTVWAGANMDSLTATSRLTDNTHLNDAGMASAATLIYNAMVASGAPY